MAPESTSVSVEPLTEAQLPEADRIFQLAFATFLDMEAATFMAGREILPGRLAAYPDGAVAANVDGALAGSNFMTNWGSFAWFGPLTVEPVHWGRGVAKRLLAATVDVFDHWGARRAALFTFSDSPKHHGLYQRFDFWPRYLTAVLTKPAAEAAASAALQRFSQLDEAARASCLAAALDLGDALLEGLDLRAEVTALERLHLGDSIWLWSDTQLEGFAVCHFGPGSEAGPDICFIKFAAVRPGKDARRNFVQLLRASEALAVEEHRSTLEAGVNIERGDAYRTMLQEGFRTTFCGVQMFRGNDPGYTRPDAYVIDDLR